jgi:hypothetical protein
MKSIPSGTPASDSVEVITDTYSLVSVALKNVDSILACKLEKYLSCISGCVSLCISYLVFSRKLPKPENKWP